MRSPRLHDALIASALVLAQAIAISPLFTGSITRWRSSIESVFIAKARFIVEHFPDLSWMPYWYLGFPFELHYTPLVPAAVAALGALTGDVGSAYRVVAAIGYALGAGGLYLLARAIGLGRAAALLATVAFISAPSLTEIAMPGLRADAASFGAHDPPLPWRLVVLEKYGEGPHVLGLSLALLATAALLGYLRDGGSRRFWTATLLFVGVAFANLIALLAAAIFAVGAVLVAGGPRGFARGLRVGAMTGLLSLTWYSPSFLRAVAANPTPGSDPGTAAYLALPFVLLALVAGARAIHGSRPTAALLAFWGGAFASIVVAWELFRVSLAPQPIRYASELDGIGALAFGAVAAWAVQRLRVRAAGRSIALSLAAVAIAVASLPAWSSVQVSLAPETDWASWSEREIALWLRDHLGPGERAYLSGSHAFWVNAFADVAQVRGGQDYVAVDPWPAHAAYQIKVGSDPDISVLWLRALGVRYVVVTGPESRDVYVDFTKPAMFEGRLALETTIQGARVYRVDRSHTRPVLVAPPGPSAAPLNALDRGPLADYVAAIESGAPLALEAHGVGTFSGAIETAGAATLLVPVAHDAGWRAYVDGRSVAVRADALGQIAVDVPAGGGRFELRHRPHADLLLSNGAVFALLAVLAARSVRQPLPALVLLLPSLRLRERGRLARLAALAGPLGLVLAVTKVGADLGAWSGFPKGTDAPAHLTRLRFVADWLPNHDWLYVWAAGMPTFESYPPLPYLLALLPTRIFGAEPTLLLMTYVAMVAFGVGLYLFLSRAGGSRLAAFVAVVALVASMAVWTWIVHNGLYARIAACGFGAFAWYAAERWHARGGRSAWVATAALLAATVASHAFMGIVFAGVVALRTFGRWGRAGTAPLLRLAGLALLLGAPGWLPAALSGGGAQRFFGADHGPHVLSPLDVLWRADHVGPAIPLLAALTLVAAAARRQRPPLFFWALAAIALLYTFAPSLGIPNALYYVNGVDPFTVTFFIALFGACAAALSLATLASALPAQLRGLAAAAVVGVASFSVISGVDLLLHSGAPYPTVFDTSAPSTNYSASRRALSLPNDLDHRVMPNSADESAWISYRYRMPQLRDYYAQGQVHPDWLALAYTTVYDPPYRAASARALLDWYAVSIVTVEATSAFGRNLPAMEASGDFRATQAEERFVRLDVVDPAGLVALTDVPLTVVVGSDEFYRTVTRTLLRQGLGPDRGVTVHWPGDLADLDASLRARTGALVLGPGRDGDGGRAADAIRDIARAGGTVIVDLAGRDVQGAVGALLPVNGATRVEFPAEWGLRSDGSIDVSAFEPARYEGGVWLAEAGSGLRDGAHTVLSLGDRPVVATRSEGAGRIVALGGNLLFHADYTRSEAERGFLLRYLVPVEARAARDVTGSFRDPHHRVVAVDAPSVVLFKESHVAEWNATLETADGSRDVRILRAGPGLMAAVASEAGTLRFTYGTRPADPLGWALFAAGVAVVVLPRLRRRFAR